MKPGNQNRLEELLRSFALMHFEEHSAAGQAAREALSLIDPPEDLFGRLDEAPYVFDVAGCDRLIVKGAVTRCTACRSLFGLQLRRMGDGSVRNQAQCPSCRAQA